MENSPPGIHTIPFGIERGVGFFSTIVGSKEEAPASAGAIATVAVITAAAITLSRLFIDFLHNRLFYGLHIEARAFLYGRKFNECLSKSRF